MSGREGNAVAVGRDQGKVGGNESKSAAPKQVQIQGQTSVKDRTGKDRTSGQATREKR